MSSTTASFPLIFPFFKPQFEAHVPCIQGNESDQQFYERILRAIKVGDISPQNGTKMAVDYLGHRAREYTHEPTRQHARLLRIGLRAISGFQKTAFYSKGSEGERNMQKMLADSSRAIIECLVRHGYRSEIELQLKFGFLKEAYEAFKKQPHPLPTSLSPDLLMPFVSLAAADKNHPVLLALAEHGVCMKELPPDLLRQLATQAVEGLLDNALARLVSDGCPLHDGDGQAKLLLNAVSANLVAGVRAMLTRHVNFHTKDEKGNSALHRAFFLGSPEMVRTLQPHIDPQMRNAQGHTPLQALFHAQDHNPDLLQIGEARYTVFLQNIFERPQEAFQGILMGSSTMKAHLARTGRAFLFPPPGDLVEIAFLLNDAPYSAALFAEMSPDDFRQSCQYLLTRYPQEVVQRFQLSHWELDGRHYATGCTHFEPPAADPVGNPPLTRVLDLFNTLNLTRPDAPSYVDPREFLRSARAQDPKALTPPQAIQLLRAELDTFIGRLASEKHFYGTPVEGKRGFIEFFSQLKRMVKHIIATLEQKKDPQETYRVLHEIIAAAPLCGGRYQETILREYLKVCFGRKDETPEEALLKQLAEFRFDLFDTIVARIPDNDAHDFLDARRNLGAKFGIPGFQQVEHFDDPYTRIHRHDERIEREFQEQYNPQAIVISLIQQIQQNSVFRDHYLNLHKKYGASEWKQDRYGPILAELPHIEATEDPEEKEALVLSIYNYLELPRIPGQSLREAILEDQKSDYLLESVYNEQGRPRPEAVEYILEKLGVFRSRFAGARRAQQPQEVASEDAAIQLPDELKTGGFLV